MTLLPCIEVLGLLLTTRFSEWRQDAIVIVNCSEGDDLEGVWHFPVVVVVCIQWYCKMLNFSWVFSVIMQDVELQFICICSKHEFTSRRWSSEPDSNLNLVTGRKFFSAHVCSAGVLKSSKVQRFICDWPVGMRVTYRTKIAHTHTQTWTATHKTLVWAKCITSSTSAPARPMAVGNMHQRGRLPIPRHDRWAWLSDEYLSCLPSVQL